MDIDFKTWKERVVGMSKQVGYPIGDEGELRSEYDNGVSVKDYTNRKSAEHIGNL